MKLDVNFVRSQFAQLGDDPSFVFAANAGGSYVCNQANTVLEHYNRHTRVQPYNSFSPSSEAGEEMDRAHAGWAAALNVEPDELTLGPSTSMNTYVMAQALGKSWQQGDEIIVTNQDHEANIGAWRREAEERGVTVRVWDVDPDNGLLDVDSLTPLLTDSTRWVFVSRCSNLVGTVNPISEIVSRVRARSDARVFVDAVAYAPHHIEDLKELGVDGYAFSLYKVFGPHQGLMYINNTVRSETESQAHYFNSEYPGKAFNPAGPQHAQVAGCAGVLDYFDDLYQHHVGEDNADLPDKLARIASMVREHENELSEPILAVLRDRSDVKLLGKKSAADNDRAPTIAFNPLRQSSKSVAEKLRSAGIGAENGHFYAYRLVTSLGLDPEDGVVRISLVHYNSEAEVERIVEALDKAIG